MNYNEALEYIHSVTWLGSRLGLERIGELSHLLGNPEEKINIIHVAGTNGKGSVCAMLSSILTCSGYKTGLFTSPYIISFNERIKINNMPIPEADLAAVTERVKYCADQMNDQPTEFELITAIALEYFKEQQCDYAILETGLGGRIDSTNIVKSPKLSVITGISLDHTAVLGETVEKIAFEKSGITKPECPVVIGEMESSAAKVIERAASEKSSPLIKTDYSRICGEKYSLDGSDFTFSPFGKLKLSLLGDYQIKNAAVVLTCVEELMRQGTNISIEALKRGLSETVWFARFEIISSSPTVIYDGAHNPQGAAETVRCIKRFFGETKPVALIGVMGDKNHMSMADIISKAVCKVHAVKPLNSRSLDAKVLADEFIHAGVPSEAHADIKSGVFSALAEASEKGLPAVVLGSLYMYSDVCAAVKEYNLNSRRKQID